MSKARATYVRTKRLSENVRKAGRNPHETGIYQVADSQLHGNLPRIQGDLDGLQNL
jgi:hypothetical protein